MIIPSKFMVSLLLAQIEACPEDVKDNFKEILHQIVAEVNGWGINYAEEGVVE